MYVPGGLRDMGIRHLSFLIMVFGPAHLGQAPMHTCYVSAEPGAAGHSFEMYLIPQDIPAFLGRM
jgi:hypothetical protein